MTKQQIAEYLRHKQEGRFANEIDERQLAKLLQQHASGPHRVKANGKPRWLWQLTKGARLSNKELRDAYNRVTPKLRSVR